MKQYLGLGGGLCGAAAVVLIAQAPVSAAPTKVTAVQLTQTNSGFNIVLATEKGDRPQVFTINEGNSFRATVTNTQLRLPQGNAFRQENPMPGIASVQVTQVEANSIQIIVTGNGNAPSGQIVQTQGSGIVFSVSQGRSSAAAASVPAIAPPPPPNQPLTQTAPPPPALPLSQTDPSRQIRTAQSPNVMVPDPQVTFTRPDQPPLPSEIQPPLNQAPPFQPRAVAPPLGDIAVSNIDPSPSSINLNTSERIPRLVLRDAPVRDVLALLARAAGLNIAFTGGGVGQSSQNAQPGVPNQGASATDEGPKISLDIENESVQDVFNYVLRLSALQANRVGRTIFVGTTLPIEARNLITRSFRLNQVQAGQAAAFLSAQGAETQRVVNVIRRTVTGVGVDRSIVEENAIEIRPLGAVQGSGALLLRGLSVLTDERLNAVTLIGNPRQVEIASAFLTQLDLRRRQVAVNVKIIDINLAGANNYNSSFSFGINNSFFVNDSGAATLNFGGINPPSAVAVRNSVTARPIISNPVTGDVFYDPNNVINVPLTAPGGGLFVQPRSGVTTDPYRVGVQDYTPFERTLSGANAGQLSSVGDATFALFPLFQYPTRFLSQLQAQITSNNAKILTDPTLVVQEGETAGVNLVEQIVKRITVQNTDTAGGSRQTREPEFDDVGLKLSIQVERIDDNGFITLTVAPEVSAPVREVPTGDGGFATVVQRRAVNSGRIRIRDAQTLIISGIIQESDRTTVNKIPILGDLPLIGALFRSTNKQNQRAEVIVLLTPQILDDSDRSSFGYQYNPSPDSRRMLQQGVPIQPRQ